MPRPKKPPGEKYTTPIRTMRVADAQWEQIQSAAKASGKTVTAWATEILLRAAKRRNSQS